MESKFGFTVKENYIGHKVCRKAGTTTHLSCRIAGNQEGFQAFKAVACHDKEKHVFLHGLYLIKQILSFFFFLHIYKLAIIDL